MGSGLSILTDNELKAHLSEEDEQSLEIIREAWKTKDSFLVPQRQSEIVEFLQDLLEEAIEETCPMRITVRVIAALGLQKADFFSESDAYVRVSLEGNEAVFKTKTINNSRSPVWDQAFVFDAPGARVGDTLTFDVFDDDFFSKDDDLGRTSTVVERRRHGRNTESVFQQLLNGGQGLIVFNYALDAPPLEIRASKTFDGLLQSCDQALDLLTQHDPVRASAVRRRISEKIKTMAAAIASDRVVTRQDIRTLSPEMTQRYMAAVRRMMLPQAVRDGDVALEDIATPEEREKHAETSVFFRLAGHHGWPDDFCAHRQENFPAWHRAYLIDFERELRKADRELGNDGHIALPYWDFGEYEVNGQVIPAVYRDLKDLPEGFFKQENMERKVASRGFHLSSDEAALHKLLQAEMAENLLASLEENNHWRHASCENAVGRPLEAPHNSAHMACGWPITSLAYAAFHPLFYNIHCNVDRYYEKYLQLEPNSMEEFEAHQKMRTDRDESVSNKFDEPLAPFTNPESKDDFFTVKDIMSTPTHDFGYVYDSLPQLRPALLSELPTMALFEKVDVAMSLRDREDNMKSFELHVFVVPVRIQDAYAPPVDLAEDEWPKWAADKGFSYAGWATAFGGKGRSCKNCRETRKVNIYVDISEQLRAVDETRHAVVLKTICVDELGERVSLEDLKDRFGENCIIPQPRVTGPLFASTDLVLSKETAVATADGADLGIAAETSQLQWYLHQFGFYPKDPDGDYGDLTEAAVRRFQRQIGLYEDGIAGPITKRAMLMKRNDAMPDAIMTTEEEGRIEEFEDVPKFPAGSTVKWWLGPHPGYLRTAHLEEEVTAAIDQWAEHAPLTFERVPARKDADLVITWGDQAEENEFRFDGRGGAIAQSSVNGIEFDINERWSLSLHPAKRYGRNTFKVLPVLLHELGHTLGLRTHSIDNSHVMGAYYVSNRVKLSDSEVARLNKMYAAADE